MLRSVTRCSTSPTTPPTAKSIGRKYFKYAERVNSRSAMVGFTSYAYQALTSGYLPETDELNWPLATIVVFVLAMATVKTLDLDDPESRIWKREAENLNGRVAMLAMLPIVGNLLVQ